MMNDGTTNLTSRCTPGIFSKGVGEQEIVIIMETRSCRHSIVANNSGFSLSSPFRNDIRFSPFGVDFQIGIFSPQTPNLDIKGLYSPPSTIPSEEKGFEPLEDLRITPFLEKNASPGTYKKRKIEKIQVSEF